MNKIGSSETIRKTTFNFTNVPQRIVPHKSFIKDSFLEWFIGFSEGDGSFIVSDTLTSPKEICFAREGSVKRLFFIINQKEEKVLHYIRANLGFGKVSKYLSYSRYIVADRNCVDKLISIFNGNLVLYKTNARFALWLIARNQYNHLKICYKGPNQLTDFHNNGWLSGFTDAEGCFNAQKIKDSRYIASRCQTLGFRVRVRFLLDQKNEYAVFEKIRSFLKTGFITNRTPKSEILISSTKDKSEICSSSRALLRKPENRKLNGMYRYTCSNMKSHDILLQYFKEYPLRTIKKVALFRFTLLSYYIKNRKSLPWQGKVLLRVENLVKNINTDKS